MVELKETLDVVSLEAEANFPDKTNPKLRPEIGDLGRNLIRLTQRLLRSLSLALGKEADFLQSQHERLLRQPGNMSKLRFLYYPKVEGPNRPGWIRCGEHSDYGTITLLFQDNKGGLEVKTLDGRGWIEADPIEGCILINVGDMMEIYSDGLFPATRHRVVVPEAEIRRSNARQSFVFFVHPDNDATVEPLINNPKADKKRYEAVNSAEYTKKQFAKTYI